MKYYCNHEELNSDVFRNIFLMNNETNNNRIRYLGRSADLSTNSLNLSKDLKYACIPGSLNVLRQRRHR